MSTADNLASVLTANKQSIDVVMISDIVLPINTLGSAIGGSGQYRLGGEATEKINVDLNGHKWTLSTNYWSGLGANSGSAEITVKNGTMVSEGNKGNNGLPAATWNSYDLTFFDCKWSFENVTFDKAVAISTAANVSMKSVTINESHDYYALWITADAANVELESVIINCSNGRAIAVKDQYVAVANRKQVTLSISNSTFTSLKKAAVLVGNTAGAKITASNVNIQNVTADTTNLVWCDNGQSEQGVNYLTCFDNISVSGCTKINEP